jgi:hypothetical protein
MTARAGTKAACSTETEPPARPAARYDPCREGGRYTSGLAREGPATPRLVAISLRLSAATPDPSAGEAGASEERSNEGGSLAVPAGGASGAGVSAGGSGGGIDGAGDVGGGGVAGGAGGGGVAPGAVAVVDRTGGMVTVTVRTVDPGGVVIVVEPGGIVTVTVGT